MFREVKKRYFTLIELLVVVTIVLLVSSVVSIQSYRFMQEQHFFASTDRLVGLLNSARRITMLFDQDVDIEFYEKNNELWGRLTPKTHCDWIENTVISKPILLQGVNEFALFDGGTYEKKEKAVLSFGSHGSVFPKGIIRLSSNVTSWGGRELSSHITMRGYPHYISIDSEEKKGEEQEEIGDVLYPLTKT